MSNNLDLNFCFLLHVKDKLQHRAMDKLCSCALMNVSDILEVAEGNSNCFINHLTASLPLLAFWYS